MSIILHITKRDKWEKALHDGRYEADSLRKQSFIHCSKPNQLISVANHKFCGQKNLVLLCIDADKVASEIRYESCEGDKEQFPHIYGPLNVKAVIHVYEFQALSNGTFTLPEKLKSKTR